MSHRCHAHVPFPSKVLGEIGGKRLRAHPVLFAPFERADVSPPTSNSKRALTVPFIVLPSAFVDAAGFELAPDRPRLLSVAVPPIARKPAAVRMCVACVSCGVRTCVITMSHRNVKPHVSIKWQR